MERLFISAAFITCIIIAPSAAQTGTKPIGKLISEWEELTELKMWMRETPFMSNLNRDPAPNSQERYTFFAPTNFALKNVSRQDRQRLLDPTEYAKAERNNLFKSHAYFSFSGATLKTQDMKNQSVPTMGPGTPPAFIMNIYQQYYMNGAKIVQRDVECSNGILHLIDRLVYPVPRSENALEYIKKGMVPTENTMKVERFSRLLEMNDKYGHPTASNEINLRPMVTVFVPQDAAFKKMPMFAQNTLEQNKLLLKGVLENHIIAKSVFHTPLLEKAKFPILGVNEPIRTTRIGNDLFVSNTGTCVQAKIVHPNVTVSNGVIHIIDAVLGYQYADLFTEIRENAMLKRFSKYMQDGPQEVQSKLTVSKQAEDSGNFNKEITVFAPADQAFVNLDPVVDLTQDADALNEVMRIHTIPQRIGVERMQNNTRPIKSMADKYEVKFRRYGEHGQDIFVEVDHVRARIIRADVCTKNGLIHIVDTVLGRAFRTVYQEVDSNDFTVAYARMVRDTTLQQTFNSPRRITTIFAFSDSAVEALRAESDFGRNILLDTNKQKLLLESLELSGRHYLDELGEGITTLESVRKFKVEITKSGEDYSVTYGGKTARVIRADIKATNGVVHIMDRVLFDNNPKSRQWIGGAGNLTPSLSLLMLTVSLMYIFFPSH